MLLESRNYRIRATAILFLCTISIIMKSPITSTSIQIVQIEAGDLNDLALVQTNVIDTKL